MPKNNQAARDVNDITSTIGTKMLEILSAKA
jgi:hypothetical protein